MVQTIFLAAAAPATYFFFFFFFAGGGGALYIKFRDVFGVIFTQIDATILIFIKACCWNTLFILIYLYYI